MNPSLRRYRPTIHFLLIVMFTQQANSDPKRKGNGIPLDQINPQIAIPACLDALRDYPNSARFQYQAGRAYEKNGETLRH